MRGLRAGLRAPSLDFSPRCDCCCEAGGEVRQGATLRRGEVEVRLGCYVI